VGIGEIIRQLRIENKETQKHLANELGVKRETVNQWENGARDLKTQCIINLAKHFNISADYLLGLTNIKIYPHNEKDKIIEELSRKVFDYERQIDKVNEVLKRKGIE